MLTPHRQPLASPAVLYLERHLEDAGQVELRGLAPNGKTASGLFDDLEPLRRAIDAGRTFANLYITIQRPRAQAATNRLTAGASGLRNQDIEHYVRLAFDLDAVRPTGTAAPPELVAACEESAVQLTRTLHRHGWPLPARTLSGNGAHLTWRTARLPADEELRADLKVIYAGLAAEIDSPEVHFDQTVRNPGRILRVPGSLNLKGGEAREVTVELPSRWRQITRRDLTRLANFYRIDTPAAAHTAGSPRTTAPQFGAGDYRSLDVVAWFTAHGHYLHHLEERTHAVRCPWVAEHTGSSPPQGGDSIIFETDGSWPGFFCHHAHCAGRDIRQVLEAWGDADHFCAVAFQRRAAP